MSEVDHPTEGSHGLHAVQFLHTLGLKSSSGGKATPRLHDQLDDQLSDDYAVFGWLRGIKDRATMLQLRKRTGEIVAIPYGCIEEVTFDPAGVITLVTRQRRVEIRGRNLNAEVRPNIRLFDGITRQRVTWVRESGDMVRTDEVAPLIEELSFR